jgi:hypothetical protein
MKVWSSGLANISSLHPDREGESVDMNFDQLKI